MEILVSALLGLIVGFLVGFYFYWRSGKDLKEEAGKLRKLTVLIIRALEEAGLAKFNRDESGEPVGLVISVDVHFGVKAGDTLKGEITPKGEVTMKKISKEET